MIVGVGIAAVVFVGYVIIAGAITGWIAAKIMKSKTSFWHNVLFGVLGSILGNVLAAAAGLRSNSAAFGMFITVGGACILTALSRSLNKGAK